MFMQELGEMAHLATAAMCKGAHMGELRKLPNIGPEIERQLHTVGITTPGQLRQRGAKQAWLDIQAVDPSACYNRLCGLQGAIENVRWHNLPQQTKDDLKVFYNSHKIEG